MAILEFILILAVLIIIHEVGHFLASKFFKVEVEEFGLGIPPKILTMFRWRGTEFTLNALPLGGFVRPKGENDPTIPGGLAAAPAWQRIVVYLAGPVMNLILAVLLYGWLTYQFGMIDPNRPGVILISSVNESSPAQLAGLQEGDEIVSIDGVEIDEISQSQAITRANEGVPLEFVIQRGEETLALVITPQKVISTDAAGVQSEYVGIGVSMTRPVVQAGIFTSFVAGFQQTGEHIRLLLDFLGRLVTGQLGQSEGGLIGLPGMVRTYEAARNIESAQPSEPRSLSVLFVIELTVSLGLLNLLPIPALDGGRILLALPELLFRRRVPTKIENYINAIGFILLLGLLIFVNLKDALFPQPLPFITPTPTLLP
jgi:regulator of sigma E protease